MKVKVAVSLDAGLVKQLDQRVKRGDFASRSAAIEAALRSNAKARKDAAYEALVALLDPVEEQALAEEFFGSDAAP